MPIYEYQCGDCGHIFEVLTTSSNRVEPEFCKKCRSGKVSKIISAGTIRKGSGVSLTAAKPSGCGCKSGFS